ncbi:MAG: hypothetical protein KAS85_00365 [Rhodobacteraceae bacterium]|nr:hypothetical protein [Paracoccaceae bacterium]
MKSFEYHDFDPEDETTLRDARFRYGDAEAVERIQALNQAGFNADDFGSPSGAPYDLLAKLMSQLFREVKEQLQSGELIAFGYTQDIIAGPQFIPCDLWRHVGVNIKRSWIELKRRPETRMTDIVVFKRPVQLSNDVDRTAKTANRADIQRAYATYIEELIQAGKKSNREQDVAAMKALCGDGVTNQYIRELRAEYAPAQWSDKGRRKQV